MININNLGDCSNKDFIDIRDNIEKYFPEYTSSQQSDIKELFKLVLRDGFPIQFKLDKVCIDIYEDKLCFKNSYNQVCYEENDILECMPIFYKVNGKEFKLSFTDSRNSQPVNIRWRVDDGYSEKDYEDFDNYITEYGSTVSIHDGDIISVCKNLSDSTTKGLQLLKYAVKHGGNKLDAYSHLYRFYVTSGFTPISVCRWDDEFALPDWLEANRFKDDSWKELPDTNFNVKREDIIFFIYTETTNVTLDYEEWVEQVEYSKDYNEAKFKRDKILEEMGGN